MIKAAKYWGMFVVLGVALLLSSQVCAAKNDNSGLQNYKMPSSWGMIKDSYNSGSDVLIVHIQDAHCDFEAQQNISRIIENLYLNHKLTLVGLEGAAGEVQNPVLSNFPDKQVRKDTSLSLMRQGKLTGAECLEVNNDYKIKLFGVEDIGLYLENLEAFHMASSVKSKMQQQLAGLYPVLDQLKGVIYNAKLKKLDAIDAGYKSGKISFVDYSNSLFEMLQANGLSRVNYPRFLELQKVIEKEKGIDFAAANQERSRLITDLTEIINDKQSFSVLLEKSLDFKKGLIKPGEYAGFLRDLAIKNKLDIALYPKFNNYIDYIQSYEIVANEKLFSEIEKVKEDLKSVFYDTEDQKQLDVLCKNWDVLERLANLKMYSEDREYFLKFQDRINSDAFVTFIEPQAYKNNLTVKLPVNLIEIDSYIPVLAKFYDIADKRDITFIENVLSEMETGGLNSAALITGGFHTDKLTKILKERNISYLVITPKASVSDENYYFNIMEGVGTPLDQFAKQLQSALSILRGVSPEAAKNLTAEQQSTVEGLMNEDANVQALGLAVTMFESVARSNPKLSDVEIREKVIESFDSMPGDAAENVKPLINNMSMQGDVVVVKSIDNNKNALVYNPKAEQAGEQFKVVSVSELPSIGTAVSQTQVAQVPKESLKLEATPQGAELLEGILPANSSSVEKIKTAKITEAVVNNLLTGSKTSTQDLARSLQSANPSLFTDSAALTASIDKISGVLELKAQDNSAVISSASAKVMAKAVVSEQGKAIAQISTGTVDAIKKTVETEYGITQDKALVFEGVDLPQSVQDVMVAAGLSVNDAVIINPGDYSDESKELDVKVSVSASGKNVVNISSGESKGERQSAMVKMADLKAAKSTDKAANSSLFQLNDALCKFDIARSTNQDKMLESEASGEKATAEKTPSMSHVVFDHKVFARVGEMGEGGVETVINGIMSQDGAFSATKNGNVDVSFAISQEVNVNPQDFARKVGIPEEVEAIDQFVVSAATGAIEPKAVTPSSVNEVFKKRDGQGNFRAHFVVLSGSAEHKALQEMETNPDYEHITYTAIDLNSELKSKTEVIDCDYYLTSALKTMILGDGGDLTPDHRKMFAAAINASFPTLQINITEDNAGEFMSNRLEEIKETRTIDLKEIQKVYVAPGTWA